MLKIQLPPRDKLKEYRSNHDIVETANHFGVSRTTICNWLTKYKLSNHECKIPAREELKEFRCNHNIGETAIYFGVDAGTIGNWSAKYNLSDYECKNGIPLVLPDKLSQEQIDIITGCLLGDGCISYSPAGSNNRFHYTQTMKHKDQAEYIYNKMLPFSSGDLYEKIGGYYEAVYIHTHQHAIFSNLRKEWYLEPYKKRSQKIIPINLKLNWIILAHWIVDDGHNSQIGKSIEIATNCFRESDVELLIKRLNDDLKVKATKVKSKKAFKIRIRTCSYFDVINNIKSYINVKSYQYKIDTSLNMKIIEEYKSCLNVDEVAKKRKITVKQVYRVLNENGFLRNYKRTQGLT